MGTSPRLVSSNPSPMDSSCSAASGTTRPRPLKPQGPKKAEPGILRWPDGRWEVFLRVKPHPLVHKWLPASFTLTKVKEWRDDKRTELRRDRADAVASGTVAADVAVYLRGIAHDKVLHGERKYHLGLWTEHFGHRRTTSLRTTEITAALSEWLAEGFAPSTVRIRRMALLRMIATIYPTLKSPVTDALRPESAEADPRDVPLSLVLKILEAFSDQGGWYRRGEGGRRAHSLARARAFVLAYTAIRPDEMTKILPGDYNRLAGELYVRASKGSVSRTIKLVPEAIDALDHFFIAGANGSFSMSSFNRAFWRAVGKVVSDLTGDTVSFDDLSDEKAESVLAAAGLPPDLTPYCFRHSFLTDLYRACGDLGAVQKYAGHKDIRMTMRYAKGAVDALATAAVAKLVTRRTNEKLPPKVTKLATG